MQHRRFAPRNLSPPGGQLVQVLVDELVKDLQPDFRDVLVAGGDGEDAEDRAPAAPDVVGDGLHHDLDAAEDQLR